MRKLKKTLKITGVTLIALLITALIFPTWTSSIKGENSISILEQVEINGSKQEMMIRGKDKDNPVILFAHGGPGAPEITYADTYQDLLETRFTVVHYDQRASGSPIIFLRITLIFHRKYW